MSCYTLLTGASVYPSDSEIEINSRITGNNVTYPLSDTDTSSVAHKLSQFIRDMSTSPLPKLPKTELELKAITSGVF